jgi:PAS domain-containing protein
LNNAELESALRRQIELYNFQPVGCFTIDSRMVLRELNDTGADMLGVSRDDAIGLAIEAFVRTEDAGRFRLAIASVEAGKPRSSCRLALCPNQGTERAVLVSIGKDPASNRYLVSLADIGHDREGGAPASRPGAQPRAR